MIVSITLQYLLSIELSTGALPSSATMCQLCEIQCSYCGEDCGGLCPDNETCPSCWTVDNYGEFDDEAYHDCRDTLCECPCHEEDDELSMFGFDSDDEEEDDDGRKGKVIAGVDNPVEKKVAKASQISFRFLDLPTELRDKIYKYTLKQTGSHRTTPFLKGRINTAILFTCRQINLEGMSCSHKCHSLLGAVRPTNGFKHDTFPFLLISRPLQTPLRRSASWSLSLRPLRDSW